MAWIGDSTAVLKSAKRRNVITIMPLTFPWFIVTYAPSQGCERKSGPAVLTRRSVKHNERLSSLREAEKEAKKRNPKLSTRLGKTWLGTNSKQFSWTKTSL